MNNYPSVHVEPHPSCVKRFGITNYKTLQGDFGSKDLSISEMNKCTRSGTVDFESHLSYCRPEDPEVWTLIGNPGCGKTFLCKYAGYNYGLDKIDNFQYLLCIPCRDPEWHAIEVARQEDREINKFIRRWLRISLPLGVGWVESLSRYMMRSGGESALDYRWS